MSDQELSDQPQTRRQIREAQRQSEEARGRTSTPLIVGVLVFVLLGGGVWLGAGLFTGTPSAPARAAAALTPVPSGASSSLTSDSPTSSASGSEATPSASQTAAVTTADPVAAKLDSDAQACRQAWQLQGAATNAAAVSLAEWRNHVDIMNRLQSGRISLAKAKAEWPATTAQASPHVKAFRAVDQAYTSAGVPCAAPAEAVTGPMADSLRTCSQSIQQRNGVLAQARTVITVWETHLSDQSHFEAGGMTAVVAEQKWRALWRKGVDTLPGYMRAATDAAGARCEIPS